VCLMTEIIGMKYKLYHKTHCNKSLQYNSFSTTFNDLVCFEVLSINGFKFKKLNSSIFKYSASMPRCNTATNGTNVCRLMKKDHRYADNVDLIAEKAAILVNQLHVNSKEYGLQINVQFWSVIKDMHITI